MKNVSAFPVHELTILGRGTIPVREHKGTVFPCLTNALVCGAVLLDVTQIQLPTEAMFPISRCQKRRHAFVQPEMVPITVGHHIPPPLMCEFVRAQPVFALIRQNAPPVSL